ncbi:hypothetical protein [Corynebacterium camporealensis]|uniref:hypothetical protein n=1 Tax=Corynebacterium camporealensis TaxID=161896 RepID=UPI000A9D9E1E|nr:hypothetical protein [Corynebacterium camporealensis]
MTRLVRRDASAYADDDIARLLSLVSHPSDNTRALYDAHLGMRKPRCQVYKLVMN